MKVLYLDGNPDLTRDHLALEGEPMPDPKILTEPESTELLDRLAPDWPLLLYDGAVIDHILKMINGPRPSRSHEPRHSSPRFPRRLPSSGSREPSSDQVKRPA
jgi:hypothetical protein